VVIDFLLKITGPIIAYLAGRGLDTIIARWVAYFVTCWEDKASKEALALYHEHMQNLQIQLLEKSKTQTDWRNGPTNPPQ
jgi:hypothetical protein